MRICKKCSKKNLKAPKVGSFLWLTWLVAHSWASPADTAETPAAQNSPFLQRLRSSHFCAQRMRTNFCKCMDAVARKPQTDDVGLIKKNENLLVSLSRFGGRTSFPLKHAIMERCSTDERKRYGKVKELQSGLHGSCGCGCFCAQRMRGDLRHLRWDQLLPRAELSQARSSASLDVTFDRNPIFLPFPQNSAPLHAK